MGYTLVAGPDFLRAVVVSKGESRDDRPTCRFPWTAAGDSPITLTEHLGYSPYEGSAYRRLVATVEKPQRDWLSGACAAYLPRPA